MFDVPESNIVAVMVDKAAAQGIKPPQYTYNAEYESDSDSLVEFNAKPSAS